LLQFTFPRVVTENTLRRGFAPETEMVARTEFADELTVNR
jgi:hypothetical protein